MTSPDCHIENIRKQHPTLSDESILELSRFSPISEENPDIQKAVRAIFLDARDKLSLESDIINFPNSTLREKSLRLLDSMAIEGLSTEGIEKVIFSLMDVGKYVDKKCNIGNIFILHCLALRKISNIIKERTIQ